MANLNEVRRGLLELHKTIVEAARREYERSHGRQSDPAFLEVLVTDPGFTWLAPLTALIVALDEAAEKNVLLGDEWVAGIRELLIPDAAGQEFNRKYEELTQQVPEILVAHGALMRALRGGA
jgi:hypothetical protein